MYIRARRAWSAYRPADPPDYFHLYGLGLPLGIIGYNHLDRNDNRHGAGGDGVEVFAHGMLEQRNANHGFLDFGVADAVDEVADGAGREASAAHARDGRHARVVPSGNQAFLDELQKLALAHYRIGEVEAVELNLAGAVGLVGKFGHEIFVERAVGYEFKRAD